MNFLAPLAFAFAATIPVVVVFYLLKRKRTVKLVPSTLLWQKFLAESQASAPFQKLRHNGLLILQILLLLLAVLALSRPFFAGQAPGSQLRIVILDASASMQATDVRPDRFSLAREAALRLVDALKPGEQMMVLLAGANTVVKQSPTSDKATLRRALQECAPSDSPTRIADALKTAAAFTFEKRGEEEVAAAEIHLFSDGAVPGLEQFENKGLPLVFHQVGTGANNLGITALEARSNPENPAQRALYTGVLNASSNSLSTELQLLFDGQLLDARAITVGPGETQPQVFVTSQARDGVFTVRLEVEDDLAVDNEASVVSVLPQPARVLLVTRGNRFLEKALGAVPSARLTVAADLADPGRGFDFVVLDLVAPTVWPEVNVLAFAVSPTNWFERVRPVENPALVDWKSTHPLLRYTPFDNVGVSRSTVVESPGWGTSLLDCPQGALMVAGELGRQRLAWVGFDPLESNWPLRVSFPIFIANAVEWLNPATARTSQLSVRSGDPFQLAFADPVPTARIRLPGGDTRDLDVDPAHSEIVFGDTARRGTYRVTAGTNEVAFCVNLLDARESNIQPRAELNLGQYDKVEANVERQANTELWRTLTLLGLAVLMFEWWWYHKRTA
ncbi:MAG: VWA domain-containing protein [Verrucomicrobia bacterium]|nr:VWA domain-containing protein [Verrucomicrobiota bacterium]